MDQEFRNWSANLKIGVWGIYVVVSLFIILGVFIYGGYAFVESYGEWLLILWGITLLPFVFSRATTLKTMPHKYKRWYVLHFALDVGLLLGGIGAFLYFWLMH